MFRILVPLAEGVEEMEAVIILDTLRRARFAVVAAGLQPGPVTAARGVRLLPDALWAEVDPRSFDALVLPGGKGVSVLLDDPRVVGAVQDLVRAGRWVCAVCAAPLVLQKAGVLAGRRATCFPGAADRFTVTPRLEDRVVVDRPVITSQGAGTTLEFALEIIRQLGGDALARQVAQEMVAPAGLV